MTIPDDVKEAPYWVIRAYIEGANRAIVSGGDPDAEGRANMQRVWDSAKMNVGK